MKKLNLKNITFFYKFLIIVKKCLTLLKNDFNFIPGLLSAIVTRKNLNKMKSLLKFNNFYVLFNLVIKFS